MDRRDFLKVASLSTASMICKGCLNQRSVTSWNQRPNLVFVFPDQFRVQAMGFMKQDPVITPNIDRFAAESLVFDNAVSNWPLCSPYRGMLMTGRWPHSTGIITNCNSSQPDVYLRDEERTFTDVLSEAGYDVGYLGKWHLDTPRDVPKANHWKNAVWETYVPKERRHGINFWYAYNCNNKHMDPYYWINDATKDQAYYPKEYSASHEAGIAADYIENADGKYRQPGKPFALFVAINPPHGPYDKVPDKYKNVFADQSPTELLNRPNVKRGHGPSRKSVQDYFSQVYGVDQAFGQILQAIDKANLRDNTIVVFSADHGEMMGSHGRMQKVVPYEESLRIPFIVRWPGHIRLGRETLHFNVPDTMPSLLALMSLKDYTPTQVEGADYSAVFLGKQITHRPKSTFYMRCASDGIARGVRTDLYTFVIDKAGPKCFLYDNQQDPYQLTNISGGSPELVETLSQELLHWLKKTNDPELNEYEKIVHELL